VKEGETTEDFQRLDLRIGEVVEAEAVEGSEKLLRLRVDLGEEKQVIAGIRRWYRPEDLIGKKVVLLANLKAAQIFGNLSQGMVLVAEEEGGVSLLTAGGEVEKGAQVL
jgi:methionyl-tRNA synthetase